MVKGNRADKAGRIAHEIPEGRRAFARYLH
jgi:hypothetical protein